NVSSDIGDTRPFRVKTVRLTGVRSRLLGLLGVGLLRGSLSGLLDLAGVAFKVISGRRRGHVDDEQVLVGGQRRPARQLHIAGVDLAAFLKTLDRDLHAIDRKSVV